MHTHSLFDIQQSLLSKKRTVPDIVSQSLALAEKNTHNAVLTVCKDRALKQAHSWQQIFEKDPEGSIKKFPLLGSTMGLKDALVLDGVRTTSGSKMLENYIPPYTGTAVKRLEQAGAITVAKLNLDEFAMGSSNENSAFGPVKHPTHPDRVPGGSSGGSATSVKSGISLFALGSDTGGSIRLPASFCGVVGLKPTYGRVSRYGLIAFASSLDQIGPMANNVTDCAEVFQVMSGSDHHDSTCSEKEVPHFRTELKTPLDFKKLKIGIPKEYFIKGISADVSQKIQSAIDWYQKQGATLVNISLPHTDYALATYYIIAVSEASSNLARFDGIRYGVRPEKSADLADYYPKARTLFGPEVKRRILLGTFALSSGYYDAYFKKACQVRRLIQNDFLEAFQKVDVILSPVSPVTAFKLGERSNDPITMYLVDIFTIPASLAGVPAIAIPCGTDAQSLPIGLQIISKPFDESTLFRMAHAFEGRS